jgi:hypothetical protein
MARLRVRIFAAADQDLLPKALLSMDAALRFEISTQYQK